VTPRVFDRFYAFFLKLADDLGIMHQGAEGVNRLFPCVFFRFISHTYGASDTEAEPGLFGNRYFQKNLPFTSNHVKSNIFAIRIRKYLI
jgi:hypothetical protein